MKNFKPFEQSERIAFTLAEVLITLGIIGVVAALTIPSLVAKYQEKQTVTALKKFYSTFSQAYIMAKNENGTPDTWYGGEMGEGIGPDIMLDIIIRYLKVSKICHGDTGCFADEVYKKIDGKTTSNWNTHKHISKFITADGMNVFVHSYGSKPQNIGGGSLKDSYGAVAVDINGFKKPNSHGKDMFTFIITKDGVIPYGTSDSTHTKMLEDGTLDTVSAFPNACNINDCRNSCEGCTAWVIYNENMDYLHCDDLSWEGKHSCK